MNVFYCYTSGLSFNEEFLLRLLKFLQELGPDGGLNLILNFVSSEHGKISTSIQSLLILFCDCCSHLLPWVFIYICNLLLLSNDVCIELIYPGGLVDVMINWFLYWLMDFRSLVDDFEMYDQQKPFSLEDLTALSGFLNTLTYKLLWNKSTNKREIFIHLKSSISKYFLNFSFFSFYSRCESLFCFISFTIASYLPVKWLLRSISFHSLSSTLY